MGMRGGSPGPSQDDTANKLCDSGPVNNLSESESLSLLKSLVIPALTPSEHVWDHTKNFFIPHQLLCSGDLEMNKIWYKGRYGSELHGRQTEVQYG